MTLQYFDQAATATEIAAATRRDGGAIVTGLASPELVDTVAGELRGYFDTHGHKSQNDFTGHQTNRCHVVLEESLASSELVAHDMVISVSDEFLLPYCDNYQIGSLTAIEINPGQQAQELHRDEKCCDQSRIGLINTYSLGWLRQEVNQYLNVPFELARTFDERMRGLLGYTTHLMRGGHLGKYFGSDTSFLDRGTYALKYRPNSNEFE